jgi:acyl carrier protein
MTRSQVQAEIRLIIIKQLSVTPDQLTPECQFANDLKADSLDLVEIIMMVEDSFGITIPEQAAAGLKTIGDLVSHVCEAKGIPQDIPVAALPKNWPPAYTPAPSAPPAPASHDCKSCGAHMVVEKICPYCGRAAS